MIERGPFIQGIDERGRWIAALARAYSRYSGLPADHILEAMAVQARHYLMRWREKTAVNLDTEPEPARSTEPQNMGPPRGPPQNRNPTPPPGRNSAKRALAGQAASPTNNPINKGEKSGVQHT